MDKYEFKRIDDIEVLPIDFEVKDKSCIGCRKTDTDMMLIIRHNHSLNVEVKGDINMNREPEFYTGIIDIMLTQSQVVDLINQLDKSLHRFMGANKPVSDIIGTIED